MVSHLFFYQLVLLGLLWLCLMLHYAWPSDRTREGQRALTPPLPPRARSRDPKPFAGLTHKPHCEACAQAAAPRQQAPCAPPPRIVSLRGRRRAVDTSRHFCPYPNCAYQGWTGRGNIRANGHPSGGPWRQLYCLKCQGYFQETQGYSVLDFPLASQGFRPLPPSWGKAGMGGKHGLGTPPAFTSYGVKSQPSILN